MTVYTISVVADAVDISSSIAGSVVLFLSKVYSLVILNNLNISFNISIPVIS